MEDSIYPIFTNFLVRLKGLEGEPALDGLKHRADDRF